jgi:predicted phage tail protein
MATITPIKDIPDYDKNQLQQLIFERDELAERVAIIAEKDVIINELREQAAVMQKKLEDDTRALQNQLAERCALHDQQLEERCGLHEQQIETLINTHAEQLTAIAEAHDAVVTELEASKAALVARLESMENTPEYKAKQLALAAAKIEAAEIQRLEAQVLIDSLSSP